MAFKINKLDVTAIPLLMTIEDQCHSHPMTLKNMESCFGPRYLCFGLLDNTELAGFYIIEKAGPDFTLMDICIAPKYQRQGLAGKLIANLLEQADHLNAENIFLEVRVSNIAAIALYEKYGFIEMGIRKNYYPLNEGREDGILMGKALMFSF